MNGIDVIDILRESVYIMIKIAAPMVLSGLVIGIIISLIQAITQIQEQTMTFVPKMLAVMGVMILTLPFMIHTLNEFALNLFSKITQLQ
jgi:flagellar biosynthetic protein FliQ